MANEFVAKNGLFCNGNLTVTGSIFSTGIYQGTASFATTSSYALNSPAPSSASYATSSGNGIRSWGTWTVTGTAATASGGSNIIMTRLGVGLYSFIFPTPFTAPTYAVVYTGESGSVATPTTPTASVAAVFGKAANGFTMSLCSVNSALVRADAYSGSVMVIGY